MDAAQLEMGSFMTAISTTHDLFAFLDATHREIDQKVRRLQEFVAAGEIRDLNSAERAELHRICIFFDTVARHHHLDEEMHIFPGLLTSSDDQVVFTASRLTQDHGWLEENWIEIFPHLEALSADSGGCDFAELKHGMDVFSALYTEHMQLEESLAYPEAKKNPHLIDLMGAGREMAKRRYPKQIDR
jgi:hemerythrin-like domain-containing protein